jgi:hypothetical protein
VSNQDPRKCLGLSFTFLTLFHVPFTGEKFESTTAANQVLEKQLEKMEPLLGDLQRSMELNKSKLKEESKNRQQLESRWEEMEAENTALRQENVTLRQECEMLGDRLESSGKETSHHSRSVATSGGGVAIEHSYGEVLDELEEVTEQLINTQQKLWKAEDNCRESQSRVAVLERALKSLKQLGQETDNQTERSLLDDLDDDDYDESCGAESRNKSEKVHTQEELDRVLSELAQAKRDREAAEMQTMHAQQEARVARANLKNIDVRAQLAEIDELKTQNVALIEEANCLREVLEVRNDREPDGKYASKQSREIACLHGKLKSIIKENVSLRQQVERLQRDQTSPRNEEVLQLKKQLAKLEYSLEKAEEANMSSMHDSDFEWYVKLEKLRKDLEGQKAEELTQLQRDASRNADVAIRALQERVERLVDDNRDLQDVIDQLESQVRHCKKENSALADQVLSTAENLKISKEENTALKKSAALLSADLDRAGQNLEKSREEAKEARHQYADVCADLEVARQVLDEAGLDQETIAREDERELKYQIHVLSKDMERITRAYADLESEFLESRRRFCDSQEDAARKTLDEIDYLTGKIAEMEMALELARVDYSEMSVKLDNARKESQSFLNEGETRGRESAMRALHSHHKVEGNVGPSDDTEAAGLNKKLGELVSQLEKVNSELRGCKDELESMTRENKKLKDDLSRLEETADRGIQVLDTFFDGVDSPDMRTALDPEQLVDGTEATQSLPNKSSSDGLFKNPFSYWFLREPPTTENVQILQDESRGLEELVDGHLDLQLRLRDVTRENEFLKEKIVSLNKGMINFVSPSTTAESAEIKQMIRDLEKALERNEKDSDELERLSQKLAATERKLTSTQTVLEETNDENDDLRAEVRELNALLSETRLKLQETIEAEHRAEFGDFRDQLKALTDKKSALQVQLDDAKIALSTAHDENESAREECRTKETLHAESKREISTLMHELDSMSLTLHDVKRAYDDVLGQLHKGRLGDNYGQPRQLSEENRRLQRAVEELQQARASDNRHDQILLETDALQEALRSQEEEKIMLADEVSRLSDALVLTKCEYNAVVEELEALCNFFEVARDEAERNGKEAAIKEIETEMEGSRERERKFTREKVKKILDENRVLQQNLAQVERQFQKRGEEVDSMRHEVHILREALESAEDELTALKERELTSDVALKEATLELRNTKDELELLQASRVQTNRAVERETRASALQEFRSIRSSVDLTTMREKLQKMLEYVENDLQETTSMDYECDQQDEGFQMKIELLDLSMSLEKIMRENAVIADELEYLRQSADSARNEGENEGRISAMKEARSEMNGQREREMKQFKEKFNAVVSENAILLQNLREKEIQLSLAVLSKEQIREEAYRMEKELKSVTVEVHEVGEFEKAFKMSKEENAKLRLQTAQLKETLEASTKELDILRGQFEMVGKDATSRGDIETIGLRQQLKMLVAEKAELQKQVDEFKVNISLQKYSEYKDNTILTNTSSSTRLFDPSNKEEEEIENSKEDVKAAMQILRQISHVLDLVDGLENGSFVVNNTLVGRAEDIKGRVSELTALLEKSREECSRVSEQVSRLSNESKAQERKAASSETALERVRQAQLRDKMDLEVSEVKCAEARKEAAGYKSEVRRLRSALENAQRDHSSLREQLEQMTIRVQQMCSEAEAKGKAAAEEALRSGMGNATDSDYTELMIQFKEFYDENVSLQMQLDRQKLVIENLERDARDASEKKLSQVPANKEPTQELDSLRENSDEARANRTRVVRELSAVKDRLSDMSAAKMLREVKPQTVSSKVSLVSMPSSARTQRDVQLYPKELSHSAQASPSVGPGDEETKIPVSSIELPSKRPAHKSDARNLQLRELQRQVQQAIEESSIRIDEIQHSARTMGGRVPLGKEIQCGRGRSASPGKKIQVDHTSGVSLASPKLSKSSFHADSVVFEQPCSEFDGDLSIQSHLDQSNSESREDHHASRTKRDLVASPRPLSRPAPVKESKDLTSRALEAIAQSKKNKDRYRDTMVSQEQGEVPPLIETDDDRGRE